MELQWPDLPDELQTSRSGKGIFATMQRGLKRYELAGKAYYELYQESSEPGYLTDALLCFIEAANWSLAKAVLDYLLMQQEYHAVIPALMGRLRRAVHLDDLFSLHRCKIDDVPSDLQPWLDPETAELRQTILCVLQRLVQAATDARGIAAIATAAIAFKLESLSLIHI